MELDEVMAAKVAAWQIKVDQYAAEVANWQRKVDEYRVSHDLAMARRGLADALKQANRTRCAGGDNDIKCERQRTEQLLAEANTTLAKISEERERIDDIVTRFEKSCSVDEQSAADAPLGSPAKTTHDYNDLLATGAKKIVELERMLNAANARADDALEEVSDEDLAKEIKRRGGGVIETTGLRGGGSLFSLVWPLTPRAK